MLGHDNPSKTPAVPANTPLSPSPTKFLPDGSKPVAQNMQTKRTTARLASIAVVALFGLAVVPALAGAAGASTVAASSNPAANGPTSWAYGGQGWNSGGFTLGGVSFSWNATLGGAVILNATNTSATTTELALTRTVMESVTMSYTAPNASWNYHMKALEVDHGYANLTNASSVTLSNLTTVPALGILNASLDASVSLQASLVGTLGNRSASDYLNVSGWAHAQVGFSPSLGLVPLNLTGVTGWSSSAVASGSAAWNVSWAFANHGWNGTSASRSGDINGTWSTSTTVVLVGHVAGTYAKWVDHRVRTALALGLTGPFDLYAGVLFVPRGFDILGAGTSAYAGSGIGATAVTSEYLFVTTGSHHLYAGAFSAANMTGGIGSPAALAPVGSGGMTPAASSTSSVDPSVYEQPESEGAAASQFHCFAVGCSAGTSPFSGLLVPLIVAGVAAAVVIGLIASRRSRGPGGQRADVPLSAQATVPTPPTGVEPAGIVRPPQ